MESGFILIAKRHVRPDGGEEPGDDSIPGLDLSGFNLPTIAIEG